MSFEYEDPPERMYFFKVALGAVLLIALVAAMLGGWGCASWSGHLGVSDPKPPVAESRPSETVDVWATRRLAELSAQFKVERPGWEIREDLPPYLRFDVIGGHAVAGWYAAGYYDRDDHCIRVYSRTPSGEAVPEAAMRATFLHEFLHHLENCNGVEPVADHNADFDRWIKILGMEGK